MRANNQEIEEEQRKRVETREWHWCVSARWSDLCHSPTLPCHRPLQPTTAACCRRPLGRSGGRGGCRGTGKGRRWTGFRLPTRLASEWGTTAGRGGEAAPLAGEGGGGRGLARGLDGTAGGERWGHFDSSVNAVSFGFVATAILIAMFFVMAVFERFLRPRGGPPLHSSPPGWTWPRSPWRRRPAGRGSDLEAGAPPHSDGRHQHPPQGPFSWKLDYPSPKMSVYARGISVLMPGQDMPTFIAHRAPAACPPKQITWPTHQ